MRTLALLSVVFIWIMILLMIRIRISFVYTFNRLGSQIIADFKFLFLKFSVEINIPKEMIASGLKGLIDNFLADLSGGEQLFEKNDPQKTKRYLFLKHNISEIKRHYVYSWAGMVRLRKELAKKIKEFYKKIKVQELKAEIQIGLEDAAQTGLVAGGIWIFLTNMKSKCCRLFEVRSEDIFLNVIPRYNTVLFSGRLNCILNLKISHIIFTALKIIWLILKNRRDRPNG